MSDCPVKPRFVAGQHLKEIVSESQPSHHPLDNITDRVHY